MQEELVAQGINLMATGMSTVLAFLALLVVLTSISSAVMSRFFPDKDPAITPKPRLAPQALKPVDATTLSVIQLAIKQHKANTTRI